MSNVLTIKDSCTGCGLCESICPINAIEVRNNNYFLRPNINNRCIDCGKCVTYCPNTEENRESATYNSFENVIWGHSTNKDTRYEAASGGIVTELCVYMLNTYEVDYIITADEYYNDNNGSYCICNTEEQVRSHKGSKYCLMNIGRAVRYVQNKEGKCAIVCLPCLARGIRKYMLKDQKLSKKIKYIIVLLCNHVPSYRATKYMLKKINIKDADMIRYRGEGWKFLFRAFKKVEGEYKEMKRTEAYWGGISQDIFGKLAVCYVEIILEYMGISVQVMQTL